MRAGWRGLRDTALLRPESANRARPIIITNTLPSETIFTHPPLISRTAALLSRAYPESLVQRALRWFVVATAL
jgi:hypothetical protein